MTIDKGNACANYTVKFYFSANDAKKLRNAIKKKDFLTVFEIFLGFLGTL